MEHDQHSMLHAALSGHAGPAEMYAAMFGLQGDGMMQSGAAWSTMQGRTPQSRRSFCWSCAWWHTRRACWDCAAIWPCTEPRHHHRAQAPSTRLPGRGARPLHVCRVRSHPMVAGSAGGGPGVELCAAAPLVTSCGHRLGAL